MFLPDCRLSSARVDATCPSRTRVPGGLAERGRCDQFGHPVDVVKVRVALDIWPPRDKLLIRNPAEEEGVSLLQNGQRVTRALLPEVRTELFPWRLHYPVQRDQDRLDQLSHRCLLVLAPIGRPALVETRGLIKRNRSPDAILFARRLSQSVDEDQHLSANRIWTGVRPYPGPVQAYQTLTHVALTAEAAGYQTLWAPDHLTTNGHARAARLVG